MACFASQLPVGWIWHAASLFGSTYWYVFPGVFTSDVCCVLSPTGFVAHMCMILGGLGTLDSHCFITCQNLRVWFYPAHNLATPGLRAPYSTTGLVEKSFCMYKQLQVCSELLVASLRHHMVSSNLPQPAFLLWLGLTVGLHRHQL